ncbi:hypothetical protein [Actinoplanes sp. NPDC049599]|jgi:FXSXX-COOH protein|uniref:hypothetical protein n=1 Tax=Actinoplanes sp. NPDC049599 TaxID=3363903 RepID=UPI0037B639E7
MSSAPADEEPLLIDVSQLPLAELLESADPAIVAAARRILEGLPPATSDDVVAGFQSAI